MFHHKSIIIPEDMLVYLKAWVTEWKSNSEELYSDVKKF